MNKFIVGIILLLFFTLISCNKKDIVYHSVRGSWRCEEIDPINGLRVYIVDIDESKSDSTLYLLSNFYNEDINEFVYAHLNGSTMTISEQTFATLRVKSGTGIVSGDFTQIDFAYTIYDGQSEIKVQATYSRPN